MISKQDKILTSALSLFVEFGFHGTPTSTIAKTAWVSNGILFHYFKTKEDLITGLYISIKDDLMKYLEWKTSNNSTTESVIKNMLKATIIWWLENKDKYHYIQQVHFSPHIYQIDWSIQESYMKPYLDVVEKAKHEKIIKNLPTYLILSILSGQINAICEYFLSQKTYSEQDIKEWVDLVWEMLRNK